MATTTRRVSKEEVEKLKAIQDQLKQKGIKFSQRELSDLMIQYVMSNYDDFLRMIEESEDETPKELSKLKNFLSKSYSGKDAGDAVEEHDAIL